MNKDEFKKIISESIEDKLREILPSVLDEYFTGTRVSKPTAITEGARRQTNVVPTAQRTSPSPAAAPKKQYVKNSVLNDILNETVIKSIPGGPSVAGGPMPAFSENTGPSIMDNIDAVPASVAGALTRDYSQLLKMSAAKSSKR
jgi:hypothetical protein